MYNRQAAVSFGPRLTPMVKYLIIACVVVFLWTVLGGSEITRILGLVPAFFWPPHLWLWQAATYIFLHADLLHLAMNMFVLWMFGSTLEAHWGSREFLRFFFITGIGAGILSAIVDYSSLIPTVGASGSIYGLLAAFGLLFPERRIYIYFLFPVKAKYFVLFIAGMVLLSSLNDQGNGIAHFAHLGGMLVGFLYLKGWLSPAGLRQAYHRWKIRRMRSRFEVYENQKRPPRGRSRDDDFWIN
ncbi:MAG TPA: rhomboid family intramembrane serine protease [Acidobacteriota bacterium]|nr:rhomboid family intramembrane serine protease [Acidobacteriota bacterium]